MQAFQITKEYKLDFQRHIWSISFIKNFFTNATSMDLGYIWDYSLARIICDFKRNRKTWGVWD